MKLHSVFVTGANRGIGLEFVKQLTQLSNPPRFVFASYRSSDTLGPLTEIKNASKECEVILIKMDVLNEDEVAKARKIVEDAVGENGLTLLINNAGLAIPQPITTVTKDNLMQHFSVNAVGPTMVFQEMLPLLKKSAEHNASIGGMSASKAAVLNITALLGSITNTGTEFDLVVAGYKISKAALNMAMKIFAVNVKDQGILVVNMCPGWVKTDMGSEHAELTAEESISAMLKTLEKLDDTHHGSFMDRLGILTPF